MLIVHYVERRFRRANSPSISTSVVQALRRLD
jgi:hypothetical protein